MGATNRNNLEIEINQCFIDSTSEYDKVFYEFQVVQIESGQCTNIEHSLQEIIDFQETIKSTFSSFDFVANNISFQV